MKAGKEMIAEHPFGVGAGDIRIVTTAWYRDHLSGWTSEQFIYPSSEWLMHGGMAGWPAMLILTGIVAYPFFLKQIRRRFFFCCFLAGSFTTFLIDTSLGVQLGIFPYCFILLGWWKFSNKQEPG
jgi:hypothetical protein